jgi:hypothetical protein
MEYIAGNLSTTIQQMQSFSSPETTNKQSHRSLTVQLLQQFLKAAMENGSVSKFGRMKWMAEMIVSDLEEFVVDPFGEVDNCEITAGIYSELGHDMVNRTETLKSGYNETLHNIVSYIQLQTPEKHLNILGYTIQNGTVVNMVNGRPFSKVDSEHFLCKAWIMAKFTFGHNRISKYPKQCNNYTHPSPVIHNLQLIYGINETMNSIENAYIAIISDKHELLVLPEFCRLPKEKMD